MTSLLSHITKILRHGVTCMSDEDNLLTREEVCAHLGISKRAFAEYRSSGNFIPAIKIGKKTLRWRRSDVDRWIEEMRE